jgi:hypothetical protein
MLFPKLTEEGLSDMEKVDVVELATLTVRLPVAPDWNVPSPGFSDPV